MKRILLIVKKYLSSIFNFSHEQEDQLETIRSIEKGVEFRGINVWTLIFAIFIASIGLNVNSTAVIIGAMLISPLMGPIMGLGLSIGVYDFELMKKSFRNLGLAVVISVLTSAIYFFISPLSEAQSELLARTTPTIYDVLIALFGGLAGIVAGASKEKGNTIPGVAIATALMPPLCTAGYGLGTGNFTYFFGAFYLFFINAVMISLSTFLIVRFLKFPLKQEVDKLRSKKLKHYILFIVTITVLPSIYFAFHIVQQTIFTTNARNYINHEFNFDNTQLINYENKYNERDSNVITVKLTGRKLDKAALIKLHEKMQDYSLKKTKLNIKQSGDVTDLDVSELKTGIIQDLYQKNELIIKNKDEKIQFLEEQLRTALKQQYPVKDVAVEANAINSKILSMSVTKISAYDVSTTAYDTTNVAYIKTAKTLSNHEIVTLTNWLQKRLKINDLRIVQEE